MSKSNKRKRTSWDHPVQLDFTSKKYRTCDRKQSFLTERQADATAQVQTEWMGFPFRSYKCSECRGWHITKHPKGMGE